MPFAVEAQNLKKFYNGFQAVAGVNFRINRGECFGILGPNGAGKTTLVEMIYCFLPVSEGRLTVLGDNVVEEPRSIKKRLGVVPQENNLDLELTVRENLLVYASYYDISKPVARERADQLLHFFGLSSKANQEVDRISGGMKRRLTIARGLIHTPEILILDEPTTGLDPQSRRMIWEHLRQLKKRGLTLVLTTHYMDEAGQLCDNLIIMNRGEILEKGSPSDLIRRQVGEKVIEAEVNPSKREHLLDNLSALTCETQVSGDTVYIFIPEDETAVVDLLKNNRELDTYRVRPSTLEDVFLKLTGRGLDYADADEFAGREYQAL